MGQGEILTYLNKNKKRNVDCRELCKELKISFSCANTSLKKLAKYGEVSRKLVRENYYYKYVYKIKL